MTEGASKAPVWFTVGAIVLILWGLMGCASLYMHFVMGPGDGAGTTDYDRQLYASLPTWYGVVYIVAVLSGLLGAIMLLMRRSAAVMLSALSVVAVIIQFGWLFVATDILAVRGAWVAYFPMFILLVQLFQLWFANRAKGKGLLR
ncbi:MAG: sugar transporter [Sphingomonas sp.]|uniref:sugar transporter n=1 Tax=Sphingomonas sp. TaxID=28214 RepID=UPI002628A218|nr:sugar transporter [Sphingomonas sp.]MDK2767376.1 sugar transporter [Sphingomonas sp.]